jgi:4-amino-4-deoxy-L-arabinose transferase-like glycosyltransferase
MVAYLFGILLLAAVILVGRKSFRLEAGVLAALFVSLSAPFLVSAHYARQEIFLIASVMFLFALTLQAFERDRWWLHFLSGLGLGLSTDIHQNALLFFPGFMILYASVYQFQVLRRRQTWLWGGGILVGVLYYLAVHIFPNPSAYFFYLGLSTDNSYAPPILSMNFGTLLQSARGELQRFHFYENSLDFALMVASLALIALRRQKYDRAYLGFLAATFVSFTLIQGSKVYFYDILIIPFYLILVSETLLSFAFDAQAKAAQRVFALCLTLAFVVNGARHVARTANENQTYDYVAVANQIRSVLQPDDRILAVPTWWLGLTEYDYKSAYMLSHYYYFNDLSLEEGMKRISPTILIVDESFWTLFNNAGIAASERFRTLPLSMDEAERFIGCCTEELLVIPNPQHGDIFVYRIVNTEWTSDLKP